MDPSSAIARNDRGNILYDLRRLEEAIQEYDVAVELEPNNLVFWNNRGNAHAEMDRLTEALSDYARCLQISYVPAYMRCELISLMPSVRPEDADVYNYRGHVYFQMRSYDRVCSFASSCRLYQSCPVVLSLSLLSLPPSLSSLSRSLSLSLPRSLVLRRFVRRRSRTTVGRLICSPMTPTSGTTAAMHTPS
jgi:tetratricopeptide (TPR) repeat protein